MENTKAKRIKSIYIWTIFIFPLLYILNSFTPWGKGLWMEQNHDYFSAFWISVLILHWLSAFLVFYFLKNTDIRLSEIGFSLKAKGIILFITTYFFIALAIYFFTIFSLNQIDLDNAALQGVQGLIIPQTNGERLLWVFIAFTAGFCEELVYRGFCIKMLEKKGINKWIALFIAAIPFIFIHGLAGIFSLNMLLFYLGAALVFGLIFILTKKLWIPMMIHMVYDLFLIMAIFQFVSK